jgi:hypothetical protein
MPESGGELGFPHMPLISSVEHVLEGRTDGETNGKVERAAEEGRESLERL